jgi:hypothetical protein
VDEASLDTPIHRATIDQLPISVLDTWLTEVRARRLSVVRKLEGVREAKRLVRMTELADKYTKLYDRVKANIVKIDDYMEKIEANINKLRALELELSDDGDDNDEREAGDRDGPIHTATEPIV